MIIPAEVTGVAPSTLLTRDWPRQAEVEQLGAAMRSDEHVRWLDVTVHQAARMQGVERAEHPQGDRDSIASGDSAPAARRWSSGSPASNSIARKTPSVGLVDFEHLADVGMVDAGGGPRFAPESRARGLVGQAGDHLQCDVAIQPLVAGHIDDAHAAAPKVPHDPIAANLVAGLQFAWRLALGHVARHCVSFAR